MNRSPLAVQTAISLRECQIQASLLLKDLRSSDVRRARIAAERLRALPDFRPFSVEQILHREPPVQRKHVLWTIAHEHGFDSWVALKAALDLPRIPVLDTGLFFRKVGGAFLNQWCARYEEARFLLERDGGYLFPYRSQYFVCGARMLEFLGIDPDHPGWGRVGYDWVRPADPRAFGELAQYLLELGYAA